MLIKKNLPNVDINQKSITYKRLRCQDYDLYKDGSISKTCNITDMSIPDIIEVINNVENATAIQIYNINNRKEKYITIQKEIKYNPKIGLRKILTPQKKILKELFVSERKYAYEYLNTLIDRENIFDKEKIVENISLTYSPKYNMSLVKTGDHQASTVLSVNNPARITINKTLREALESTTSIITIIKPTEEYGNYLRTKTLENVSLLDGIKSNKKTNVGKRVHTINDSEKNSLIASSSDIWLIDTSIIIKAKNLDELIKKTKKTIQIAEQSNIILYWHTNSTNKQFTAMFPGYGRYNEHLTEATREFVKRFVVAYMR